MKQDSAFAVDCRPCCWKWCCRVLLILLCFGLTGKPGGAQALNGDAEIVYLDEQGFLRVQDIAHPSGALVQWVSPVGGWQDFALGDFNGDGDAEIVAIRGDNAGGQIAIYDPVIASGLVETDKLINGIPWRILYESTSAGGDVVKGSPVLVAAGNLDAAVPGDEIVYIAELTPEEQEGTESRSRLVALHATNSEGSVWESFGEPKEFGNVWTQITTGDVDGSGVDDVVVVDDAGIVLLYRLQENVFTAALDLESESRPWQHAVIAPFLANALPELILARSTPVGSASLLGFGYAPSDEGNFKDVYSEFFWPSPKFLFAGDINGNGDDEIFFLRPIPNNNNTVPRLVMRNRGNDSLPAFEEILDTDNGFQSGTAADVDNDSKAEVILIRNTKLRIYDQPEVNKTFTDHTTPIIANPRTVQTANLDQNGYVKTPELSLTPNTVQGNIAAGGQSPLQNFTVTNSGGGASIPFSVRSPENPAWLRLNGVTGQTPANFTVLFDARTLSSGVYTTTLLIESSNTQVSNTPLSVGVTLTVDPGLLLYPLRLTVASDSCAADAANVVESVTVDGPTGMTFVARIGPSGQAHNGAAVGDGFRTETGLEWPSTIPWASAQSSNLTPTTMQVTFSPSKLTGEIEEATLELVAVGVGGEQIRHVQLVLFCTKSKIYLPLAAR